MNRTFRLRAPRPVSWGIGCCLAMSAMWSMAQESAPAPTPLPTFTKPLYLEWGITTAMIALAIFVVCRKSNRT